MHELSEERESLEGYHVFLNEVVLQGQFVHCEVVFQVTVKTICFLDHQYRYRRRPSKEFYQRKNSGVCHTSHLLIFVDSVLQARIDFAG